MNYFQVSTSDDEDDEESQPQSRPGRVPLCSMHLLSSWYAQAISKTTNTGQTPDQEDTGEHAAWEIILSSSLSLWAFVNSGERPPVVIIIQEFEAFSSSVLQDLILSLG